MQRPFDARYRRHGSTLNENAGENEDAKALERSFKNRGLKSNTNNSSNSNSKSDLLLRNKNVNQVLNQQRSNASKEKGKQRLDTPKKSAVKKDQSKSLVSLKRPGSEGNLPIPKRAEIEHCNPHEEELPYVPDDIAPLDFDIFDGSIDMNAYESTNDLLAEYDSPLQELESFRTTKRQFQQNDIDDTPFSPGTSMTDEKDDSLVQDFFTLDESLSDEPLSRFPSEIEFCPSPEEELPYDPELDHDDLALDLSVFTPGVNISAYDLSKHFDEQAEFSDLYDDEDSVINLDLSKVSSLMYDHDFTFEDLSIFLDSAETTATFTNTLCNQGEQEIDYDEIPFSNHLVQELPLVN